MGDSKKLIRSVKGVKDVTPEMAPKWRFVEETALETLDLYNFREIRIPIFEKTEVFQKSIGETTDIVEKEMYTFTDRGNESLTLRPEGTASVVRAFIEHKMYTQSGAVKLYYMGPMFRAERPQAGRFRQFHQIGAEVFGSGSPAVDAELIIMLMDFFNELKIQGLKIRLNSLGCQTCRPAYREALHGYLKTHVDSLCDTCKARIDRNPLRVLDCKSAGCQEIAAKAPTIDKHRCDACEDHLDKVRRPLMDLELPVVMDPGLVRGLDYYTRTAFEVVSDSLGAQNSVAGGGRYDNLVEMFGGPPTPAIGFAIGLERLISLVENSEIEDYYEGSPDIFIVSLTDEAQMRIFEIAHRLRSNGYRVERTFETGSIKSQMRKANKSGARFALIIGEDELSKGVATIREMETGEQKEAPFSEIITLLDEEFDIGV